MAAELVLPNPNHPKARYGIRMRNHVRNTDSLPGQADPPAPPHEFGGASATTPSPSPLRRHYVATTSALVTVRSEDYLRPRVLGTQNGDPGGGLVQWGTYNHIIQSYHDKAVQARL